MSCSQFLQQLEFLMKIQRNSTFEKPHYWWLSKKKSPPIFLSAKQECVIRQIVQKMSVGEQMKVMQSLTVWLEGHPFAPTEDIPDVCIGFLNKVQGVTILKCAHFTKVSRFRRSLRRFTSLLVSNGRKRVKFADEPVVFCIAY
ncbi:hypothetical protein RI129_008190 [Pyrocoelia pectoralis]|uniref:Uncharacterized protein n=1 Tax=Pyrocoelia pectoralis TaxID=417401 RepID=A0AAN7ZK14_9COLE